LLRKARPAVPAHLHTGIDIKRPNDNYLNEPIYPIAKGIVISKKTNGPYAQLIVEHYITGLKFWSLYEHIAGIVVDVHDSVEPAKPIGRFMNVNELKRYGWQFDHVHLEILKVRPLLLKPDKINPDRYYEPYSLICYLKKDLDKYYYDPLIFLEDHFKSD
jgi:murein DD-endopeptidase MepM/ murein hydrolase activator NlpD